VSNKQTNKQRREECKKKGKEKKFHKSSHSVIESRTVCVLIKPCQTSYNDIFEVWIRISVRGCHAFANLRF
jgi:hypothetical protein